MALDTFANLKTAVRNWTRRNDIDEFIVDVIDICETEIYANPVEPLAVRELETRATAVASTSSRFIELPTGYLAMRRLQITTTFRSNVEQRAPSALVIRTGSGRPRYCSISSQIEFDRQPDSAYALEMFYYKRPTVLSDANTTNTVLTNYPNIYLHGCAWAAYDFAGEEVKADARYKMFMAAIQGANKKDRKARFGPAPVMASTRLTP